MAEFPVNVIETTLGRLQELLPNHDAFLHRPMRPNDPARSVAMFAVDWMPDMGSHEIGPSFGPTLANYLYRIQVFVKHADEAEGRAMYAADAKNVRLILYRDMELRSRLTGLQEVVFGMTERLQRFGVRTQKYLNNELRGHFLYLATTEFWVQTESIQT